MFLSQTELTTHICLLPASDFIEARGRDGTYSDSDSVLGAGQLALKGEKAENNIRAVPRAFPHNKSPRNQSLISKTHLREGPRGKKPHSYHVQWSQSVTF